MTKVPDHLRKYRFRPRYLDIDDVGFSEWFFSGTRKEGHCLVWTSRAGGSGYPHVRINGKLRGCHHVAYYLQNRKWPDVSQRGVGRNVLTHSCDRKECVNHKHLKVLSNSQNLIDGYARGRFIMGKKVSR